MSRATLGKAEVECGDETIEVVFLTEAIFEGRIFVIGHANDTRCFSRNTGRRTTSIIINKSECGVVTTRSQSPPGLFSNVKIMISFHDEFITKVDRGYEISCFYMQADKTVTYPITVATQGIAGLTEIAEMPRCRYEVIDPETKDAVDVVTVGSKLLHRWTCDSTAPDLWCMTVHSCRVEDGSGTEFMILDEKGCSIDRYLLDNLEYGPGALQAQKEAHAFKFADKVVVNFQCSVRLDIRNGECAIPKCEDPIIHERRLQPRSAVYITEIPLYANGTVEVDVRAQQIDVLDPQIDFGLDDNNSRIFATLKKLRHQDHCISREKLVLPTAMLLSFIIVTGGLGLGGGGDDNTEKTAEGEDPEVRRININYKLLQGNVSKKVIYKILSLSHGTFIGNIRLEPLRVIFVDIGAPFHFGASTRKFNLTEYNTALNRRIPQLPISVEEARRKTRPRGNVSYIEEEEIINPEDVDPSIGRFRNLVATAIISNNPSKRPSGVDSKNTHEPPRKVVRPGRDFSLASPMCSTLGGMALNAAPDLELYSKTLPEPGVHHLPTHSVTADSDEPHKKKYAKESWPGRKPVATGVL
uniref:ZP domain-containing protein n=1 Tax=Heterorhabditis bacteriophora TaxID=37862 RepID=A0A1I7WYD3_HETBA